jgi:hypothetical protein
MLYVKGIVRIVRKTGKASVNSFHSISFTTVIIRNPTTISAGAVAAGGTMLITGQKKKARKKGPLLLRP